MNAYWLLLVAIAAEIAATIALRMSEGFTKAIPTVVVIAGYAAAFYLLSIAIKTVPLSVSYAMWAGLGTAGAVAAGIIIFRESFSFWQFVGAALIIGGVVLLNFGKH